MAGTKFTWSLLIYLVGAGDVKHQMRKLICNYIIVIVTQAIKEECCALGDLM